MQDFTKGHRQRLKDKFFKNPESLYDYELLELLLTYTIKRKDTKKLAKQLLNEKKNLKEVIKSDEIIFKHIKGLGKESFILIKLIDEILKRIKYINSKKINFSNIKLFVNFLFNLYDNYLEKEVLFIFLFDKNKNLVKFDKLKQGYENEIFITIKEITSYLIKHDFKFFIITHNHTSLSANPSNQDKILTKKLYIASKIFNFYLLDHIIINLNKKLYFSFYENGYINKYEKDYKSFINN